MFQPHLYWLLLICLVHSAQLHIFLVYSCTTKAPEGFCAVLDVPFFLSLSSRCALTFLTPSWHMWTMYLHSSFIACPCFHLLYAAFVSQLRHKLTFRQWGQPPIMSIHVPGRAFLVLGERCPSKLGSLPQQIYSSELPSLVFHLPVPWTSPKFAVLKSRVCILFCYLPYSPPSRLWAQYFMH